MQETKNYTLRGYEVEIVFSGAPGWFDFYINGKPWGCARARDINRRVQEVIDLKEHRASRTGGAL
jgi:hypothetical protein